MSIDRQRLGALLDADAAALRLPIDAAARERLLDYLALLQRWNATYNLTAIRDPEQMLSHHLVDSLAVVPELDARAQGAPRRIVDVGSGAGLPGVVLAVLRPHWQVCCVDAVEKKVAFVRQVAGALKLPNLRAEHVRIESWPPAQADWVISRAFASLQDFARLAGRHVAADGVLLAMKGQEPREEVAELEADGQWRVGAVIPLAVPRLPARRCLLVLHRHERHDAQRDLLAPVTDHLPQP